MNRVCMCVWESEREKDGERERELEWMCIKLRVRKREKRNEWFEILMKKITWDLVIKELCGCFRFVDRNHWNRFVMDSVTFISRYILYHVNRNQMNTSGCKLINSDRNVTSSLRKRIIRFPLIRRSSIIIIIIIIRGDVKQNKINSFECWKRRMRLYMWFSSEEFIHG